MASLCLQERYAPESACYGCGPANPKGLHVRSFAQGEEVVADWRAEPHHEAFPGMLNGGVIGSLLDCHCNWTAAYGLLRRDKLEHPPCTVTAEYTIQLRRPTPTDGMLRISSRVIAFDGDKVTVEGEMRAGDKITATCRGVFVAVKPGHPAYHRW